MATIMRSARTGYGVVLQRVYTSRDVRFDETTRGYHGGANYREEQSRPDDWNVVEWSNAMSFKPTTEPDSPTEQIRASSQEKLQWVQPKR